MSTAAFIAAFDKWQQQGDGIADDEGGFAEVQAARDAIVSGPEVDELIAALRGLFEHCAMVHKHWGDGDNTRQADAAVASARAALAKVQP
jgi:hypothetical protein